MPATRSEARSQTKLYVVVDGSVEARTLGRIIADAGAAAILIAPSQGASLEPPHVKSLIEIAQSAGVAALIEGDAALARTLRADGVHLPWAKDIATRYRVARDLLGDRYIVGADAGRYRDDAMTLGEAGADYVGFGIPAHVEDRETARARRLELVEWWNEIFEVPCVALDVESIADATALAAVGADFVALRLPQEEPADWIRAASAAVASRESAE
jgi:thiamine-phosphate pyrophosphorylase